MTNGGNDPSIELVIDRALAIRDKGQPDTARKMLEAALGDNPGNMRLWQTLGTTYRALDESVNAIAAFAEAARLAPNDFKPAYGIAQASLEAGRAATALFDRARALAPSNGSLLLGRAAAQLGEGQAAQAIADLDVIVAANPFWLEGQSALARLRWQMGDRTDFAIGYLRALAAAPGATAVWLDLINLYIHVEDYAEAAGALGRAKAAIGAVDALLPLEAICASELGDTARADRLFVALSASPDIAVAERHIRHLLRTGRAEAAAARAEPLLDHPQSSQIWPYAALAWRLTGDSRIDWLEGDPALIGVQDLDMGELLEPLADRLRAIHRAKAAPLGQSVRGGTQTDGPLFAREEPEIRALRGLIVEAVGRHITAIGELDPTHPTRRHIGKPFRFAGSWSVRLTGQGHHSNHIHPQGWLSSAFYVSVPPQEAMGPAPAGWLTLGAPPAELGLDLRPYRTVEPKPGRLVLFPSILWHGTAPIAAGERLTVAFDIAAIGQD